MLVYIFRKLNLLFFTLFGLSLLSFCVLYFTPGDPVFNYTGQSQLGAAEYHQIYQDLHLDRAFLVQYYYYLGNILSGDWGISITSREPILKEILQAFPATLELAFYALMLAFFFGLPIGSIAALRKNSTTDYGIMAFCLLGISIPVFWLGLLLILLFSLNLGILPSSGRLGLLYDIEPVTNLIFVDIFLSDSEYRNQALYSAFSHTIMPAAVVATVPLSYVIRTTRATMLELLRTNFIKAAQAKGLSPGAIFRRHVLPNTLLPVSKQLSSQLSTLLTAVMVTESVFSWPGIGKWLLSSIYQRDYPAIQGGLLAVSSFIIILTIINDILHTAADPVARRKYYAAP